MTGEIPGAANETAENRLKRLKIRSWRRGIKEMDLILGPFADKGMRQLTTAELDRYEALLGENDQDLYTWFSGREPVPAEHVSIVSIIQGAEKFN